MENDINTEKEKVIALSQRWDRLFVSERKNKKKNSSLVAS